jgi:Bacterial Ig-like domain (group 2)
MHIQSAARLMAGAIALFVCAAAGAQPITVQQFGATAVNGNNNALYNLTVTPNAPSNGALITGTQVFNTDASAHGSFFAVVRVSNSVTSALDLIAADPTQSQIVRYPGPGPGSYAVSSPVFTWSGSGYGPKYPIGLAADSAGNVYAISAGVPFDTKPALWILPFNATTGVYGAPILVDNTCGIVTEVLVAQTAATPVGAAAPAWNIGDVLVLTGNILSPRVLIYSHAAIQSVLANPGTPLGGPTSTAVSSSLLQGTLPVGMDIWPADATHGVSLLITTVGGRVLRYDSAVNGLAADFAGGLGLGLERIKVGTYSTNTYAYVAQYTPGNGRVLQFGAPPASGSNRALTTLSTGANDPLGLAATSSGSVPVTACIAPNSCDPLGSQLVTQISGSGSGNIPPTATVLEESCVVNADPRVTVSGTNWSCAGGNLDVANFCPGFPSTVLPGFLCGHSGPTGSGFVAVKATAKTADENLNNAFIQDTIDPNVPLPGPLNLNCPQVQIFAWAPRSDLPSIEGTVVEGGPASGSNYFIDLSGFCDKGGGNTHSVSMYSYGLGLNSAPSGLSTGLPGFVTAKFTNLESTITEAGAQIAPSAAATLQGYISQAQAYFNSGVAETTSNGFSCAMNSLASADSYLRSDLSSFSGAAPPGNINPAGEIDGRLANLFLWIDEGFLSQPPNAQWPTNNVPPCVTLTIAPATVVVSSATPGTATLTWAAATPAYPLLFAAAQCTLSASDGTFATATGESGSGTASTGNLALLGTYSAQITCSSATGNTVTSFTEATANVIALVFISVTPPTPQIAAGGTSPLTATGTYTDGSMQNLTASAVWSTSNASVATVSAGVVQCNPSATVGGSATISATGATATGTTTNSMVVTCLAPVLNAIALTPPTPAVPAGGATQLSATGNYSSGPPQSLTGTVTWSSSAPNVATVSSTGLVTCNPNATVGGSTTIMAMSGSTIGTTVVNCQAPVLNSITVTPAGATIAAGSSLQFTATGTYSSGPTQNLTGTTTWSVSPSSVASISASGVVTCNVKASGGGSATIYATNGGVTGSATVICQGPVCEFISVTPVWPGEIRASGTLQLTAVASFGNGMSQNVTSTATWSSSNTSVATVSAGLVQCLAPHSNQDGVATIIATVGTAKGWVSIVCEGKGR